MEGFESDTITGMKDLSQLVHVTDKIYLCCHLLFRLFSSCIEQ